MSRVSVIMNCYNGAAWLREALDSVYAQTFSDWEIIFFDNASTDDSPAIAAGYDARLRYFRNERTVPLGAARNAALGHAGGEFIGFLDTDDRWMPQKLAKQVALFEANPRVGLVHSDVIYHYQQDGTETRNFAALGSKPPRGEVFGWLLRHNAVSMPSVMLRAEALREQREWFDERFEIYPDFDLFRRIAWSWEVDYVDEALAWYRIHGASSSTRHHRRAAEELAQCVDKFRRVFPGLDERYPEEMRYLEAMIAYQRGKSHWREGHGGAARTEFARHLGHPKMLAAWLASLVPYTTVERVWKSVQAARSRRSAG